MKSLFNYVYNIKEGLKIKSGRKIVGKVKVDTLTDLVVNLTYDIENNELDGNVLSLKKYDIHQLTNFEDFWWRFETACSKQGIRNYKNFNVLDITGLDFSNVTSISKAFFNSPFKEIKGLENIDLSKCCDFSYMFSNSPIKKVSGIKNWNIGKKINDNDSIHINGSVNVINLDGMFSCCVNLVEVSDLEILLKEPSVERMFENCVSLEKVDISNINTTWIRSFYRFFYNCTQLKTCGDISNFVMGKSRKNLDSMFKYCVSLQDIGDISKWDISRIYNVESMFERCKNLSLDISNWEFDKDIVNTKKFCFKVNSKIFKKPKKE